MSTKKVEKPTNRSNSSSKKSTASPIKISSSTSPSKSEKRPSSTQIGESAEDASRPKVALVENTTIGYVHELSKLRRNRGNTMDYCSFQLQTATKNVDALLYSPHKRPLLHESQERRSPVKLTSFTYTPAKDKIIVNDMTAITTPQQDEYSFQYQTLTEVQPPVYKVLDVLNTSKEWDVVTVKGKIFGLKDQRMVGSPRKRLKLLEAVLDDGSGRIPIDIWESHIDNVKTGHVYTLSNVHIRVWSGRKKLATTMRTTIQPLDDQLLRELPTDNDDMLQEQTHKITEVSSIQNISKYLECVHCNKSIIQAACTDIINCEHCGFMMKKESCQTKVVAKIAIKIDGQENVFRIHQSILEKIYPDVHMMDNIALGRELLYNLINRTILYNTANYNVLDIQ